ncbi:MAG TPA: hypothetical protein VL485_20350 [Ktedonobacteraceae bacterium]|jgi:hypothetical protein|nr:hypothetical protein [Ktedonobacteraceae bacterium]
MRVQHKALRYWKTEHKDLDGCQDAYEQDPAKGLFVVTDGAGTTLFPAIWARILANHFVNTPLLSNDPFEVEWWVRQAQDEYKLRIPRIEQLQDWSIRQKAQNQSSDATLASVRFAVNAPAEARAELLVFGDSCVIIGNTLTREVESFVLQNPAEFAQAPICIPSSLRFFNRYFHRCTLKSLTLRPEHVLIIASDAVSKWILSAGGGHYSNLDGVWEAFRVVENLERTSWPGFIETCRDAREMVNDDSTALIIQLFADSSEAGVPLGITTSHNEATIQARKAAFEQARQVEHNNEMVAIYYGDGQDIRPLTPDITAQEIAYSHEVADALREVLHLFRQAQNSPGLAARMQPVWQQYGPILQHEQCAENIRKTLLRNGVNLSLTPPQQQSQESITPAIPMIPVSSDKLYLAGQPRIQEQQLDQQEKKDLELNFLKAYASYSGMSEEDKQEHYEDLLSAAAALEAARARYTDIYNFLDMQKQLVAVAHNYKQATEQLQKALLQGNIVQITAAYHSPHASLKHLTPAEIQRVHLAQLLVNAYNNDDDKAILIASDEILQSGNQQFLNLTQQDQARIDLARQRLAALHDFEHALQSGRLQQIAARYHPILDTYKELGDSERDFLHIAQEFAVAFSADDDEAIAAVHEKLQRSFHHDNVAFTTEERRRIERAEAAIQARQRFDAQIVAKVKEITITLGEVRKVCILQKRFYLYWIERYKNELTALTFGIDQDEKIRQIDSARAYIDPKKIAGNALKELTNDVFIREKIEVANAQALFLNEFNAEAQQRSYLEFFQASDYPTFLKSNRLSDDDVIRMTRLFLRYLFFKQYFSKLVKDTSSNFLPPFKKSLTPDEWLGRQRKEVAYEHGGNFEHTSQWLTEQLYPGG